ncbi:unnamed protein product [Closterium sp. NIES-53]
MPQRDPGIAPARRDAPAGPARRPCLVATVAALPRPAAAAVAALPRPAAAGIAALPRSCNSWRRGPAPPCTAAEPSPCSGSGPAVAAVVRPPFSPLVSSPARAAIAATAVPAAPTATVLSTATAAPGWHANWGCRGGRAATTATAATATTAATTAPAARGGGRMQLQRRPRESLTPQQLREWYVSWGCRGGRGGCRPGVGSSGVSGSGQVQLQRRPREALSPQQLQFGDDAELPSWLELLRQRVDIFALDYDTFLTAMYALSTSAEGACPLCVPPDPGIQSAALGAGEAAALGARTSPAPGVSEAAALGAGESTAPGTNESALSGAAPAAVLHTFTLDSGASRSFFRDSTTLTPLSRPVAVSLADPSGGPALAHSSTVLPYPVAPSGLLSGLHLPSFSTNLVSGADLQDAWVDQFTPGGQRVTHCTCSQTGRHLATFTRRPGSSLYTLTTVPPSVSASGQVAASSQVFAATSRSSPASAPCSCCPLSHETLLWHHCLGHPSLPRLRGMASCALVSGLPRSLPPLPPGPAPTCVPCVEGWQPRVRGQGHERYFLLVIDDYSRYTTVFPLRSKGEVPEVLIDWICGAHCQLSESFGSDLPGIRQTFTLPASPQQNGIFECRIGMVMDVARTSMIHAAAPHFLWPFAVQYVAHQINLQPRVSLPETTPTLRWTGKVGDASAFRVWGSRAFVRDTTTDKLSSSAVPCVFLGFPPDAPGWQFYHPTSRHVLSSQDIMFDESVSYYHPAEPVEVAIDSGATRGAEPAGAGAGGAGTGGAELERVEPGGAESGGAEPGRVEPEGTVSGGAEPARAESGGALGVQSRREPLSPQQLRQWYFRRCRGAAGAAAARATGGAGGSAGGAAYAGGAAGASGGAAGAGAAGGAAGVAAAGAAGGAGRAAGAAAGAGGAAGASGGAAGAGAAGGAAGAGGATGAGATGGAVGAGAAGGAAGAGAAGTRGAAGAGAARAAGGAASAGAAGGAAGTGDPGAEGTGPVSAILGSPPSPGPPPPFLSPPPIQSQSQLQLASPLPGPSPYSRPTRGLTEQREPESRPVSPESRSVSPVRSVQAGHVSRPRPPLVPGTHSKTLRPSTAPQRVPLPSPPASSLPAGPDPASDSLRAASLALTRFLATAVTDPLFESTAASALVAELVDFAADCHLDYATSLVAESASASVYPPSVGGECALGTDVLEDRQEDFECFAASVPHLVSMLIAPEGDPNAKDIPTLRSYAEEIEGTYSSEWQAAMDAEMASWKSTGTYVDEVPLRGANMVKRIFSGMWIFRVKRPPGSPPVFKARYVARGFSQRQGVDFFQTFSPTPKMTTLEVLLHVAAQRDYELHSLHFSTAFLQGSLHEEIWLRRPHGFTGSFPAGTQWSLRWPVYGLRQAPREWHDTLRTTLAALGFAPSTSDPFLFLRADTTLPPFYFLVYVDDLVFATADTEALAHVKSELQKRHTRTDLGELTSYLGLRITRDRAQRTITLTQSHMVQQVFQRFSFTYSLPQSTPLPTGHSLLAPPSDESVEPSGPYPELVGCLMYLMTCTRPDLAYPLSLLARYVAPGRHRKVHWDAAKRVLRYLCNTSGMGLVLGGRARVVLTGHADASCVDDLATQRSSQGYTFSLGFGSVSWRSTRSSSVLSSTCEAEIYAGAMAAQELRWLTYLLTDVGEAPRSPPFLYCGQLRLAYVASQANIADVFTKALQPCDHQPSLVDRQHSMVDRVPTLRSGAAPALQKGDLPTQQVDGVPTLQQSGCPALPCRRQLCACSQVYVDDWPDLHRCATVGLCLRMTSHIDFGIPTRSRLRHRDFDDVRVPSHNSSSRLPGRPRQPQVLWSTTGSL